jgi:hypothetical protein
MTNTEHESKINFSEELFSKANDIVASLESESDPKQIDAKIDHFISEIEDAAEKGEVVGSTGVKYGREELLGRLDTFRSLTEEAEQDSEVRPFSVLPTSLRNSFRLLMKNDVTASSLKESISIAAKIYEEEKAGKRRAAPTVDQIPFSDRVPRSGAGEATVMDQAANVASNMIGETQGSVESEPIDRGEVVEDLAEVAVDQVVDEPAANSEMPSPWSLEAAEAARTGPTKEHPHMFGLEDRVLLTTVRIGDRDVRALTTGQYIDEDGKVQMLLGPVSIEDVQLFEGKHITKSLMEIQATTTPRPSLMPVDRTPSARIEGRPSYVDGSQEGEINGNAMTQEELRALIDRQRAEQISPSAGEVVTPSVEVVEESELDMNKRWLRESRAELDDLYKQLRRVAPGSYEADGLTNQIRYAKEDVGKYARAVAKLEGNTNWH